MRGVRRLGVGIASTVWSLLNESIRFLVRRGILKPARLSVRVISVGNIQVGGAGKTPLVARMAQEAHERGLQVCILTRGYRGSWESSGGVILPGLSPVFVPQCGDEAALLHDLCPHAFIGVGADRVMRYQALCEELLNSNRPPLDLVILDDGFQHWRIHKDIEVVALTSAKSTEVLFRDFPRAAQKAHLLVWTKGESRPEVGSHSLVRIRYRLPVPSVQVPEVSFWLVTGVVDGGSVYSLAIRSGYRVVRHIENEDHAHYRLKEVSQILQEGAKNRARILLTGKDWVKWRALGIKFSDVTVLEPELVIIGGEGGAEHWSRVLWKE